MFDLVVRLGYKEIEVGFPAASQTDFDFVRELIETDRVPDDVRISVLTQAREELIERTVQSLVGAKRASVHLYNAAAPMFRRVVFGWPGDGRAECQSVAIQGTQAVVKFAETYLPETDFGYEYSPEIFMDTEADFALAICERRDGRVAARTGPGDHHQPAVHRRAQHAERLRRPDRMDEPEPAPARVRRIVRAYAQRPRHSCRRRGTGDAGRGGPGRRMPVRKRRAVGQRRLGDTGSEPLQPGHRPADRLQRYRRDPSDRGVLQPHRRARTAPLRRGPGLHIVLRIAPGRDQEGVRRAGERRRRGRPARPRDAVADAVLADRPEGRRPVVRGSHSGQFAVRQGRRCLPDEDGEQARPAAPTPDRVQPGDPTAHRGCGRRGRRRADVADLHRGVPGPGRDSS